jgi:pimeloyl-ACP methyl ester carboxylesterase
MIQPLTKIFLWVTFVIVGLLLFACNNVEVEAFDSDDVLASLSLTYLQSPLITPSPVETIISNIEMDTSAWFEPTTSQTKTPKPAKILTQTASNTRIEDQQDNPPEFEGKIDVGGYKIFLHCMGTGTPTVILEAGFDDVADTWSLVQPEVAKFTRACAYDRAGLGQSDPGPEPRDSIQVVKELHTLLINASIEGPYVLVGHSLGGMYMRLFADQYPEEVKGLVLVDSSHIDQYERNAAVLPTESPNESESLKFYREWFTNPPTYPELPRRLFEPGSLGNMPLVVLTSPHKERATDLPDGLSDKWDEIWVELQNEWTQISSRNTLVMAYKSGHFIQLDQPNLVIAAISQVVEDAWNQQNGKN